MKIYIDIDIYMSKIYIDIVRKKKAYENTQIKQLCFKNTLVGI